MHYNKIKLDSIDTMKIIKNIISECKIDINEFKCYEDLHAEIRRSFYDSSTINRLEDKTNILENIKKYFLKNKKGLKTNCYMCNRELIVSDLNDNLCGNCSSEAKSDTDY